MCTRLHQEKKDDSFTSEISIFVLDFISPRGIRPVSAGRGGGCKVGVPGVHNTRTGPVDGGISDFHQAVGI